MYIEVDKNHIILYINEEVFQMELIREVRKVLSNDITMHVPDDFLNKDIEITIKKIADREYKGKKERSEFNAIRLDTRGFKFNREEAHER